MARKNIKSKRIILELLHNPNGNLTKYRLSKLTETNISWIIQFLRKLEKKKIVINTKVINFDKLIDFYLELDKKHKTFDFYLQQPLEYLKKIKIDYIQRDYRHLL